MNEQLTINEIIRIRESANAEIEKIFTEQNWQRKHNLTDGDVRAVIAEYQKMIADKKDI